MKLILIFLVVGLTGCSKQSEVAPTPDTKGSMGSGSAVALSELYYPASIDTEQSSTQTDSSGNVANVSVRETSETPDKIREFFDSKLGKAKNEVEMETGFTATWEKESSRYMVSVTRLNDKSTIVVTVSGK